MAQSVTDNIETIIGQEEDRAQTRRFSDRIADSIASVAGTVFFVLCHFVWFGVWTAINLGWIRFVRVFDPYPFSLLCMLVSMEGVLLAAFVLIKQNRMSHLSDRRAHLDLQVNLLTEKEVTKILQLLEAISNRLGLEIDGESKELAAVNAVHDLARELDQKLPRQE